MENIFDILIFINMTILALDGLISEKIVDDLNDLLTLTLVIETIMKLISKGFHRFLKHHFLFSLIVFLCFLESLLN